MGLKPVFKWGRGSWTRLNLCLVVKKCFGQLFLCLLACLLVKTMAGHGSAHLSVCPVRERLKEENQEFKARLGYKWSLVSIKAQQQSLDKTISTLKIQTMKIFVLCVFAKY